MARDFVAASSTALSVAASPITTTPLSMACWFNLDQNANTLIMVGVSGSNDQSHRLAMDAGGQIYARTRTTSNVEATGSAITTGTWQHGCAVFASATSRAVYLNGGNKATNATNRDPSGFNNTRIGSTTLPDTFADGRIAWPCIWNVALTDDEALSLSKGIHPLRIRPASVVFFSPIGTGSPEPEWISRNELTLLNAPGAFEDYPLLRTRPLVYPFASAAAASSIAAIQGSHNRRWRAA